MTMSTDLGRAPPLRMSVDEACGVLGFCGADARNRTADPFITSEVLCQLSYVGSGRLV